MCVCVLYQRVGGWNRGDRYRSLNSSIQVCIYVHDVSIQLESTLLEIWFLVPREFKAFIIHTHPLPTTHTHTHKSTYVYNTKGLLYSVLFFNTRLHSGRARSHGKTADSNYDIFYRHDVWSGVTISVGPKEVSRPKTDDPNFTSSTRYMVNGPIGFTRTENQV